jgi:hypothetical protein
MAGRDFAHVVPGGARQWRFLTTGYLPFTASLRRIEMDTNQTNRITMFKTVAAYMDDKRSEWSVIAPLQTAVDDFKSEISAIDDSVRKQETPSGAADDKAAARDALEEVLFLTCEALGVLAHGSSDHDLSALTSVSISTLRRFGEEELSIRAAQVLAEAKAREAELATLNVTKANVLELENKLKQFNEAKARPRTSTANRAAQTESLPNLIRSASSTLRNRIDRMVSLLRPTNPDFVAGYKSARVIVDRAATHKTTKTPGSTPPVKL